MMDDSRQVILALGSNSEQEVNMYKAKALLVALLGTIDFSKVVWTQPIGIRSNDFLNCLAVSRTSLDVARLNSALKKIEHLCGDTSENRKSNVVKMDIDILRYDTTIMHEKDWDRPYILSLLDEMKPILDSDTCR